MTGSGLYVAVWNLVEAAEVVHASTLLTDSSLAEHESNTRQWAAAKCFSCEGA